MKIICFDITKKMINCHKTEKMIGSDVTVVMRNRNKDLRLSFMRAIKSSHTDLF